MKTRSNETGSLTFTESSDALCLGTDALLLAAFLKRDVRGSAVELGAGSGAISLIAAKRGRFKKIKAVEIQPELAELCQKNVVENGLSDVIETVCADLRELNAATCIGARAVFANPPYMRIESGKTSPSAARRASRHEVFGGINEFCACAGKLLKTGGRFYTVYRPDRLESLMSALREHGFSPKRMTFVASDTEHEPSIVLTEAVKDAGEALFITPTLFLSNGGEATADARYIYENGAFPEKFVLKNNGDRCSI